MKHLLAASIICLSLLVGCDKTESNTPDLCPQELVISQTLYNDSSEGSVVFVEEISWNGSCISIELGYSGCDQGHSMTFVTDGEVNESFPPQVSFGIIDNDPEACAAFFVESYEFGIADFDVFEDYDEVIIHFKNTDKSFTWKK